MNRHMFKWMMLVALSAAVLIAVPALATTPLQDAYGGGGVAGVTFGGGDGGGGGGGDLPFTGFDAGLILLGGTLLVGMGLLARRAARQS